MSEELSIIRKQAFTLAKQLYPGEERQQTYIVDRLIDFYNAAKDQDVLVVYSPGGWGSAELRDLIDWELSIVEGVKSSLTRSGLRWTLVQYLRTKNSWWDHLRHLPEQLVYAATGKLYQARVMAVELEFIKKYLKNLKIVLLGASQGAAFDNSVMKCLNNRKDIYSIELGIFFAHLPRRVITENTLVVDSNGLVPDPVVHWNFVKALRAYSTAPFRWIKYKMAGERVKFTYCINVPGHEYRWEYVHIRSQIINFIETNLAKITGGI